MDQAGAVAPPSAELVRGIAPGSCRAPASRSGVIARDALVKRLLDAPATHTVVVRAPAGYGKTTAVLLWDEADPRPFAWVHVDPLDDDPVHLLRHLAVALAGSGAVDEPIERALTGPGHDVDLDMLPALLQLLERRAEHVLVIDDVHLLTTPGARRCLDGLLARVPEHCQLVLVGRTVSAAHLARHRLARGVFDLEASDLAMSPPEAARLFREVGVELADAEVEELVDRTEGWPGGLHLAALALARDGCSARDLAGSDRLVADYLVEEVLSTVAPDMREFLERSAVLGRMSPSLLDALLETDDAGARLEAIEQTGNLFLVPLDGERRCYRYHHLLRDTLRQHLRTHDPDLAVRLERRASSLLEDGGDADGAVRHAVAAGDVARSADLVLSHTQRLVHHGNVALLGQWLALLGPEVTQRLPAAAVASAWYGLSTGDLDLLRRSLAGAERLRHDGPLADGSPSLSVALATLHALTGWRGVEGVVEDAETVRAAGGPGVNPWWTLATVVQGTALSMLGRLHEARARFVEALRVSLSPGEEAVVHAHLALLALREGDLVEADRSSTRSLEIMARHHLDPVVQTVAVHPIAAVVAARCGRPHDARREMTAARRAVTRLGHISPRSALLAHLLLAETALVLGDRARARAAADEAERARRTEPSATHLNARLRELRARLDAGVEELPAEVPALTDAEMRVLSYLPTHLSLKEIAEQLYVSRNTAKSHSVAIYRKLGASSRSEAVRRAHDLGILTD